MKKASHYLATALRVVVALFLCVTLTLSCVNVTSVLPVRHLLTHDYVYSYFVSLDYSTATFPDGNGGYTSLTEAINSSVSELDVTMSADEVRDLIETFSFNVIAADFVAELRDWLIDDAPEPKLDPNSAAEKIIDNLPSTLLTFLSMMGGAEEILPDMLAAYMEMIDVDVLVEELEPYKETLSEGRLYLSASFAIGSVLALMLVCGMKIKTWSLLAEASAAVGGIVTMKTAAAMAKAYSEGVFAEIARELSYVVNTSGKLVMLTSVAVAAVTIVLTTFARMIKKAKEEKNEE